MTDTKFQPARRLPRSGPQNLQDSFNTFVTHTFSRKAAFDLKAAVRIPDLSDHYQKHFYFITFHVMPNAYSARDGFSSYNAQPIFTAFKSWYLSVCKRLLGPKFNKKPLLQPFTMAFLDVEGSRFGRAATTFEIPHIHALMLIHPKVADTFSTIVKSGILTSNGDSRIGKIDIKAFVDDGRGAEPLLTYAAKYSRTAIAKSRIDMPYAVYPDLGVKRYPLYQTSEPDWEPPSLR